jgi:hypothetical protein
MKRQEVGTAVHVMQVIGSRAVPKSGKRGCAAGPDARSAAATAEAGPAARRQRAASNAQARPFNE